MPPHILAVDPPHGSGTTETSALAATRANLGGEVQASEGEEGRMTLAWSQWSDPEEPSVPVEKKLDDEEFLSSPEHHVSFGISAPRKVSEPHSPLEPPNRQFSGLRCEPGMHGVYMEIGKLQEQLKLLTDKSDHQLEILDQCLVKIADMWRSKWKPSTKGAGFELRQSFRKSSAFGSGARTVSLTSGDSGSRSVVSNPVLASHIAAKERAKFASIPEVRSAATVTPVASETMLRKSYSSCIASMIYGEAESPEDVESIRRGPTQWDVQRRKVWQFMEDAQASTAAWVYSYLSTAVIVAGCGLSVYELFFPSTDIAGIFEALFVVEIILRFFFCPNRHLFWFDKYNVMDLFIITTSAVARISRYALSASLGEEELRSMKIFTPTLMLLRLLRRFEQFHLLVSAFGAAFSALPVLLYTLLLIALFFAGLIYLFEPRSNVATPGDALWLTMITMSTVGYGDIAATTLGGRVATLLLTIISGLYTAIPIGIVGTAFSKVWEDRDRLLVMQQMRERIAKAGYTARDLCIMFAELDQDGNHMLSFEEFKELLPMMHISMTDDIAMRVFETFDDDGEGTIDFKEFLLGVFPAHQFWLRHRFAIRRKHKTKAVSEPMSMVTDV